MQLGKTYLSKREQQIMELVYETDRATALELCERLPGSPSNSTVRTLLRILVEKGELLHENENGRYVYRAAKPKQDAGKSALKGVVDTFFEGSVASVMATLLTEDTKNLTEGDLDDLQRMIDRAREEGR